MKKLKLPKTVCPMCRGQGHMGWYLKGKPKCEQCKGKGYI